MVWLFHAASTHMEIAKIYMSIVWHLWEIFCVYKPGGSSPVVHQILWFLWLFINWLGFLSLPFHIPLMFSYK